MPLVDNYVPKKVLKEEVMQTFYFTDPGKVRDHNEDNVIILKGSKLLLIFLQDSFGQNTVDL